MSLSNPQPSQVVSPFLASKEPVLPEASRPPRAGDLCPVCQRGRLDYDGLLNLGCQECGFAYIGCFT